MFIREHTWWARYAAVVYRLALLLLLACKGSEPAGEPAAQAPGDARRTNVWATSGLRADVRVRELAVHVEAVRGGAGQLITVEAAVARPPAKGSGQVLHALVECKLEGSPKQLGISWESDLEPTGEDPQHVRIENGTAHATASGCGIAFRIQRACTEADARANRCDRTGRVGLGGGCVFPAGDRWEVGDCARLVIAAGGRAFDPTE